MRKMTAPANCEVPTAEGRPDRAGASNVTWDGHDATRYSRGSFTGFQMEIGPGPYPGAAAGLVGLFLRPLPNS